MKKYKPYLGRVDLVKNQVEREKLAEQEAVSKRKRSIQQQNKQRWLKYQEQLRSELAARYFHSVQSVGGEDAASFSDTTSFQFDGGDEAFISSNNFTSLDGGSYMAVSFWVKVPDVSLNNENLIVIDNSSGYTFLLFVRTNGVLDATFTSSGNFTRSNTGAITDNTWHHVYVRFDGSISSRFSRLRIFVDGSLNHASSNFGNITAVPTNSQKLYFARNAGGSNYSPISLNEIAFYTSGNDSLPAEIYGTGKANDLSTNSITPNNWWRSENATHDGTNWTMSDEVNSVEVVSENMDNTRRKEDVPG